MSIEFLARTPQGWLVRPNIEVMQFPGGEWHLKNHDTIRYTEHFATVRGGDVNDLAIASLWANLVGSGTAALYLFLPYLPAARADRGFPLGALVYSNIVDTIDVHETYAIDPHSEHAKDYYKYVISDYLNVAKIATRAVAGRSGLTPYRGVIAPDKGARERAEAVAKRLGVPVYFATKARDPETGKLSNFQPPDDLWVTDPKDRYLVVDDICDGGGTFMGLAESLALPREQLDLWITHGVFSGNAGQLVSAYGNIYTTDSHPGARNPEVGAKVTPLLPYFLSRIGGK